MLYRLIVISVILWDYIEPLWYMYHKFLKSLYIYGTVWSQNIPSLTSYIILIQVK